MPLCVRVSIFSIVFPTGGVGGGRGSGRGATPPPGVTGERLLKENVVTGHGSCVMGSCDKRALPFVGTNMALGVWLLCRALPV
jgi:hypothetical protein